MPALFADLAMARRLEEAEAFAAESFARELARRRPGMDVAIEPIAGGRAVFAGVGSPLSETRAVGLHGPVTEADLDRMESLFFDRGDSSRVVVCPLADPSLVEGLNRRGYRISGFEDILIRPIEPEEAEPSPPPGIVIRRADRENLRLYASVVTPGFAGPGEPTAALQEMMAVMGGIDYATPLLAWIDDVPVGGGMVLVRDGLALLAGASTLADYRNRGVHAALHRARLELARLAGCDVAAQGAQPGTTSHRNAERRGFRVAYTRVLMVRDPA